jgi:hypothetical protein
MKKERQIGIRVGLPVFFALEVEDVYKHAQGPHQSITFADFCGFLMGVGLEAYRKRYIRQEEPPDFPEHPEDEWEAEKNIQGVVTNTEQRC